MKKLSKVLPLILGLGLLFTGCTSENEENGVQTEKETQSENGQTENEISNEQSENEPDYQVEATLPAAPAWLKLSDDKDYDGLWFEWSPVEEATTFEIYYNIDSYEFDSNKLYGSRDNDGRNYSFEELNFRELAGHLVSFFMLSRNENGLSESYAQDWYYFPTVDELEELMGASSSGGSGGSSEESTVTVPTAPVMQSLTFTTNEKGLTIRWRAVSDANSYNVYRAISANSSYIKIASNITGTAYDDLNITIKPKNSYYYRITAVNSKGESEKSQAFGTTFSSPTLELGHKKLTSSQSPVGMTKVYIGSSEYKTAAGKFTKKEEWAETLVMSEYGELEWSRMYHYKKSDGTQVWSKKIEMGSYNFVPSHNYKIDCRNGTISSSKSLSVDKKQ